MFSAAAADTPNPQEAVMKDIADTLAPMRVEIVDCRTSPAATSFTAGGVSPVAFFRDYVDGSTPVLFQGGGAHLPAIKKWRKSSYFKDKLRNKQMTVALTPNGLADAIVDVDTSLINGHEQAAATTTAAAVGTTTERMFMNPAETQMSCDEFFSLLKQSQAPRQEQQQQQQQSVIPYMQAQCGCFLDDEYRCLHEDLYDLFNTKSQSEQQSEEQELSAEEQERQRCVREANEAFLASADERTMHERLASNCSILSYAALVLGELPEATNIWIGGPPSVTSLHQDWVQNFYLVVRGTKRFTLMPPTDCLFCPKVVMPEGTWRFDAASKSFRVDRCDRGEREDEAEGRGRDDGGDDGRASAAADSTGISPDPIAWVDFDEEKARRAGAHIYTVDVEAGDVLFFPAGWYHQVSLVPADEFSAGGGGEEQQEEGGAAVAGGGASAGSGEQQQQQDDDEDPEFSVAVNFWFPMKFLHMFQLQRLFKCILKQPDAMETYDDDE